MAASWAAAAARPAPAFADVQAAMRRVRGFAFTTNCETASLGAPDTQTTRVWVRRRPPGLAYENVARHDGRVVLRIRRLAAAGYGETCGTYRDAGTWKRLRSRLPANVPPEVVDRWLADLLPIEPPANSKTWDVNHPYLVTVSPWEVTRDTWHGRAAWRLVQRSAGHRVGLTTDDTKRVAVTADAATLRVVRTESVRAGRTGDASRRWTSTDFRYDAPLPTDSDPGWLRRL